MKPMNRSSSIPLENRALKRGKEMKIREYQEKEDDLDNVLEHMLKLFVIISLSFFIVDRFEGIVPILKVDQSPALQVQSEQDGNIRKVGRHFSSTVIASQVLLWVSDSIFNDSAMLGVEGLQKDVRNGNHCKINKPL